MCFFIIFLEKNIKNIIACLEVQRGRGVEGSRGDGRRVKGNGYPSHYLDAFKISKEEESNQSFILFGCFKNQEGEKGK